MKTPAKMIPDSARANITTWFLESLEDLSEHIERAVLSAATEAINLALEEEAHAWFPIEWEFGDTPSDGLGGPPPSDLMTIYVELPLGESDGDSPTWSFSLSDVVNNAIESMQNLDGQIADVHQGSLLKIRDGLQALVDKIDAATTSKPTRGT